VSTRKGRLLGALVALAMLAWCATHLRIENDISTFMPASGSSELAALSRGITDSPLTRQMVLSIGAPDIDLAVRAARRLADDLVSHPQVAWLRAGIDEKQQGELYRLYFPRRHYFLSSDPARELPERLSDAGLRESARRLRAELRRPSSALVARIAGEDPLLAFPDLLSHLVRRDDRLTLRDGVFVTRDGGHAIVLLGTRASPFDGNAQRELLAHLRARVAAIGDALAAPLVLESTGVNRFALDIEDGIRGEIRFLIAGSTLGVVLLFLAFFRSARALAVSLLPHALGVLLATTVGLAVFGHLNGLAIAFGVSLIGVSIDYAVHLLCHRALAPATTPTAEIVRRLRPALLLGGATTIASLFGLAVGNFPGFHQMGVLATIGVAAALAVTLLWVPGLMPAQPAPRISRRSAQALGRGVEWLERHRTLLSLVPVACVLLAVWGVPRIHWVDDLAELQGASPEVVAETERVRERVTSVDPTRFVIAEGATREEAIARSDQVHALLSALVEAGALDGFRSLHDFVRSESLQRANLAALRADPSLPQRLDAVFAEEGFRPGAFAGFADALAGEPPPPLRLADLEGSPLGDVVRALALDLGDRHAVLAHLRGVRDPDAIAAAVADLDSVRFFDQKRFFRDVYGGYRKRVVAVVAWGCVSVFALLLLRYRSLRPALAAALPSMLVAGVLAAIAAAAGTHTHILHLIGLILVMGMGVDYGIFVVDAAAYARGGGDADALGATMHSLLLSALTTLFVFGMLGLSAHPVLSALGRTTATGIALSFLLAPVSLVVVGRGGVRPAHQLPRRGAR
jgi:predicted exporter